MNNEKTIKLNIGSYNTCWRIWEHLWPTKTNDGTPKDQHNMKNSKFRVYLGYFF
jgi:hypothetical protein